MLTIMLLLIVVGAFWAVAASDRAKRSRKEVAEQQYLQSLARLKKDPGNPDLRQQSLELGRSYSAILRERGGNTVFDEVAIMNDINAACARTEQILPGSSDVDSRLRKLQDLRDSGLIDDADYARRKAEILSLI